MYNTIALQIQQSISKLANAEKQVLLSKYFKTGKGEYGAGDQFLGVTVPQVRSVAKQFVAQATLADLEQLLLSKYHEERLCALEILKIHYNKATDKAAIVKYYLEHRQYINNWDLVDLSCSQILGDYLYNYQQADYQILQQLVTEESLWSRRIATISTIYFVKHGLLTPSLELITLLLQDPEELIAKANGWILREIGKQDLEVLRTFLRQHILEISRITLRYAIEKMDPAEKQLFLHLK